MDFVIFTLDSTISLAKAANVSVTGFVVVLLILALLAIMVRLLSQGVRSAEGAGKKKNSTAEAKPATPTAAAQAPAPAPAPTAVQQGVSLPDNCSAGQLELYDVDEKSAAVIMAIVSHESGVPLNRLLFKSIKAIRK